MKMSVILGKKQIVLASLVTILGIAVYLNYVFTDTGNFYLLTALETHSSETENYGEGPGSNKHVPDHDTRAHLACSHLLDQKKNE